MSKTLQDLRSIYVMGIGWHKYQHESETSYVQLGLTAIRQALTDAKLDWQAVESSYVATARLGMAAGRAMLKHLGASGKPLVQVENASASGSAAFRLACIEVASGISDVALAVGVDKVNPTPRAFTKSGIAHLADDAIVPFTHFALLTDEYIHRYNVKAEDIALVAVKNHRNGAQNPNAQRQKERTLAEILGGKPVSGTLTSLQCCPVGEGAAAAIVVSEEAIKRFNLDASRTIRVASSVGRSERPGLASDADATLTRETISAALMEAQIPANKLDVLEVHDAFTVEELLYAEASGLCKEGAAVHALKNGEFNIGGRCAVSPSGGLIAMGHPIGPTGIGQIGEITLQLRGEAGARQQPNARMGLAHMVGLGSVCYAHVLSRD
ncbi:MAG TPA: thiolase family protein [Steroidobacteraceae bacterium]|nr:thiolase family protein [Steroidobacteraceae bacterium]